MILQTLLFPFKIVFVILRTIFFPWYLRWIFKLPWIIYIALAGVVAFFGYEEYLSYNFERFEAEYQIDNGVPPATKLSQWDIATDLGEYAEVNVAGLYFPALPGGTFDPVGSERAFVPLADDQGREVKAVLVVRESEMTELWEFLGAQGSGERVVVTVNGRYNGSAEWENLIANQLSIMGIPGASELVVIEPFMGDRPGAIRDRVQRALDTVIGFGAIAGLLVILGLGKLATSLGKSPSRAKAAASPPPAPSQTKTAKPRAEKIAPKTGNKVAPNVAAGGTPWGSFEPQPRAPTASTGKVAPQTQKKAKPKKRSKDEGDAIGDPEFVSVFPGGGSGFRFKTADEIIRETFGTLSVLTRKIDPPS